MNAPPTPPAPQGGWGQLIVDLSYNPMQFILSAVTPKLFLNQQPQMVRSWGPQVIPLPQGRYYVTAAFPYMGNDMTGRADVMIDVYANYATRLKYESPFFMWSSGTLLNVGTTPIQHGWGR